MGQATQILLDGFTGNINIAGTLMEASDVRLKKNIHTLDNALDNALKLRGVSYNWIDPSKGQRKQIGVIAQEVEEIYPEFVHTNEDGMKSVNYSQMVAVLIESIKELNAKITTLETENTSLKASLETAAINTRSIETLTKQLDNIQQLIGNQTPHPGQSDDEIRITELN